MDADGVARRPGEKQYETAMTKKNVKSKPADLSMGYARKILRKELEAKKAAASSGKKLRAKKKRGSTAKKTRAKKKRGNTSGSTRTHSAV